MPEGGSFGCLAVVLRTVRPAACPLPTFLHHPSYFSCIAFFLIMALLVEVLNLELETNLGRGRLDALKKRGFYALVAGGYARAF